MKRSGPIRGVPKRSALKRGASKTGASKSGVPDRRAQAQRAALNALKRARRAAEQAGVALSEWEGEFLGSVSERVASYGRAFADPEKGAPGAALSSRQGVKLKEIVAKAKGKPRAALKRRPFRKPPEPA